MYLSIRSRIFKIEEVMKEICGFKGLDGNFYEKEKNCKIADLEFKLKGVEQSMNSFESLVKYELMRVTRHCDPDEYLGYERAVKDAKKVLVRLFSERSEEVKKVYKYTEELHKEAEEFKKLINYERSPWWIKIFKRKEV